MAGWVDGYEFCNDHHVKLGVVVDPDIHPGQCIAWKRSMGNQHPANEEQALVQQK